MCHVDRNFLRSEIGRAWNHCGGEGVMYLHECMNIFQGLSLLVKIFLPVERVAFLLAFHKDSVSCK